VFWSEELGDSLYLGIGASSASSFLGFTFYINYLAYNYSLQVNKINSNFMSIYCTRL
jgi:hypothetical protein